MESNKIKQLYQQVFTFHKDEKVDAPELKLEDKLKPTLRSYQERAVLWMLNRELEPKRIEVNGHDVNLPHGGILADEMGLGKTVEMLACILSNKYSDYKAPELRRVSCQYRPEVFPIEEEYRPQRKRTRKNVPETPEKDKKSGIFSDKYASLRRAYEQQLSAMSAVRSSISDSNIKKNDVQCFCDKNESNSLEIVECESCGVWQHAKCLGIEDKSTYGELKCTKCWSKSDILPVKATLIITPTSIIDQWEQEIEKHVGDPDFKYIIYDGVKNRNYIQPHTLGNYDVVLTTYNVLCSEINYIQEESGRSLRHAKKYHAPTSPLTCLRWWRVCLDEAQMVEGYTSKTASMASQLCSYHRWAVTGTPIQKSIQDLFGLMVFLHLEPFNDIHIWNILYNNSEELFNLVRHILWRTSKQHVNEELGVPPQSVVTHWLDFSPVEAYFYKTLHLESASSFQRKLSKYDNLSVKLSQLDRVELNRLLLPLLGVRQACTHPQVVRGKFLKFKNTMTMEELMTQMVAKAKNDADVALRQLVSSIHGLAAINIIEFEWEDAVKNYRRVLHLSQEYNDTIKVDTLQMIHCLHNLAEVLEDHGAGIPPTLRDADLRNQSKILENNYLKKYSEKFQAAKDALSKISNLVKDLCEGHTLGYTGWWHTLINLIDDDNGDLLTRIKIHLDDNLVPGQKSLSEKLTGLHVVYRELACWLGDVDSIRLEALAAIRHLEVLPFSHLIETALTCHVSSDKKKRKKNGIICHICDAEAIIKKYEALIFSVNELNLNESDESEEEEQQKEKDSEEREERELKNVKLFKTNKESSWKPTSQERIIHVLAQYAKRAYPEFAEQGTKHMTLLETVRKEFKHIRAVWRTASDQVYATDELCMAKLRLRLPTPDELLLSSRKKSSAFILDMFEIDETKFSLQIEAAKSDHELKKTTGTLLYLKNVQQSGTIEQECPICKDPLTDKWSVMNCGHCCCFDCMSSLLKKCGRILDCPLCRLGTPKDNISYVVSRREFSEDPELQVNGSHSTKVTAVVSELLKLLKGDPLVKVLVVSTWDKVLEVIKVALTQNKINFRRIETGTGIKFKNNLAQFKTGTPNVLLLPLKHGAKGLNLTEATHLFFVEPVLNPGEEQQAVGRIHRIGQTKPTFVHRFVVRNTIEERMISSLVSNETDWEKENITLEKLNSLFLLNENEEDEEGEGGGEEEVQEL